MSTNKYLFKIVIRRLELALAAVNSCPSYLFDSVLGESKKRFDLEQIFAHRITQITKFIKEQEGSALLSSLGIKTPFNKIPLLGPLLF